jgi:hypothetical protein
MNHEKLLLKLVADDLRALQASALGLENEIRRLSSALASPELAVIAGEMARITGAGFSPIEEVLRAAGVPDVTDTDAKPPVLSGVLAEARRCETRRADACALAHLTGLFRRAARFLEMSCTSLAGSALQLGLTGLSSHLRAWSREWIGLELTLNAVSARPRVRATGRPRDAVFAAA